MIAAIMPVIIAILKALIPAIMENMNDTAENGAGIDDEDRALAKKIKEDGW